MGKSNNMWHILQQISTSEEPLTLFCTHSCPPGLQLISRVFPRALRLISGTQNLSALLSAKTKVTTYQSICQHPPRGRYTQTAACLFKWYRSVPICTWQVKLLSQSGGSVHLAFRILFFFSWKPGKGRRMCRMFKSGAVNKSGKQKVLN